MEGAEITSDADFIEVVFNDMAAPAQAKKAQYKRSNVDVVLEQHNAQFLIVRMSNMKDWPVSVNGAENSLIIKSVNGAAPTDNDDLYDKLKALMKG